MNKKKEFKKFVVIWTGVIFTLVLFLCFLLVFKGLDTSIACYVIPTSGGIWGASIIWYSKVVTVENAIKIMLGALEKIAEMKKKFSNCPEAAQFLQGAEDNMINKIVIKADEHVDETTTPAEIQTY